MYPFSIPYAAGTVATVKNGRLQYSDSCSAGPRLILRGGHVVDPKNGVDAEMDLAVLDGSIAEVSPAIRPEKGDRVVDCTGLLVFPGLMDMHLHLGDLFEVNINPIANAAADGVAFGFSPGAGNTFMAPALLGAEVDRGLPMNVGVYVGGAAVTGTSLSAQELIALFQGKLDADTASQKLTRSDITNTTAPLVMGIKEHSTHYIMTDEDIDLLFEVSSGAGLLLMSHTQDPTHITRMLRLSKGRPFHLGHANMVGCGSHMDAEEGMRLMLGAVDGKTVTAEFVSTTMRPSRGSRESIFMTPAAQQMAYDALAAGKVKVLVSDGQNNATMKGGGDTRDNLPAILELAQQGVLSLSDAVATMTSNVAQLFYQRTKNKWWTEKTGHLGVGALANIVTVDPQDKLCCHTIVGGEIVAFENRLVPRGMGAGGFVTSFGLLKRTGVGDMTLFRVQK